MKSFGLSSIVIVLFGSTFIASSIGAKHSKSSKQGRSISFDSEGGKIDIDLDLSVPFLSIPLDNRKNGGQGTFLNVNAKALTIAGVSAAVIALVAPLFSTPTTEHHHRSEDDLNFWDMSNSVNDLFFGNKKFTPCIQRAVCTVVSKVARSDRSTSNEKIIDGITSHRWFENVINGTAIQEAVATGREGNRDCSTIYRGCLLPARMFDNILDQYGSV